jgi:tripartite-type tricarboxylate transporter receptor subunit TctC
LPSRTSCAALPCTELFEAQAKVKLVHVTYKAAPLVMAAVISGEIQVYFSAPVVAIPQIKVERVRALGVSTRTRLAMLPDVPTIAESGLPGFEATGWNGVLAPAKTPLAIIERLNTEIARVARSPEMRAEAAAQGVEAIGNSPAEFARIIRDDIQKWQKLLKKAGAGEK